MKRLAQVLAAAHESGVEVTPQVKLERQSSLLREPGDPPPTWKVNWSATGARLPGDAAGFARDLAFAAELAQRLTEAEVELCHLADKAYTEHVPGSASTT